MKTISKVLLSFILVFSLFMTTQSVSAKIVGTPEPTNVNYNGLEFSAPQNHMGYVEARDKDNNKVWEKELYKVETDPNLETDVQWVFIKKMEILDGMLIATNDKNENYTIDLNKEIPNLAQYNKQNIFYPIVIISIMILFAIAYFVFKTKK
ncbi:MAG: hypothetical protein ACD_18C00231G0003 [uncultured bacterium]|nr:MAG: hypothetical protein ACD_18C00231G0003 [uncultured bacterium]OGH83592.1 MAG: hypothetical protein A2488_02950 [Candidatus Magasanikbacteria bacterium RIFOXYC12_FULL_32_21b]OGH91108.1 MAG: hypothetical protein A2507_04175 [Candidatus Magasanikbacteria bacterium RIFOXYD12_FULL_33_17]HAO52912.1 hypothetical protein [Candidatus Magasanikbacteria bacterium]